MAKVIGGIVTVKVRVKIEYEMFVWGTENVRKKERRVYKIRDSQFL